MKKRSLVLIVIVWAVVIAAAECILLNYETRPSLQAKPPEQWPHAASIQNSPDYPTLLMFVHPHCPCSRASLEELNVLMTRCRGKVSVEVLFLKPEKFSDDWTKTDHWKDAAMIPGVKITVDQNGQEARRFGVLTSGETLLYGVNGQLLFSGGITASRGHSGDNVGRSAIESIVLKGSMERRQTPVFGCSLRNPSRKSFQGFLSLWKQ